MTNGTNVQGSDGSPDAGDNQDDQWKRIAIAVGGLVAVLAIVLVVVLVSDNGDDDSSNAATSTSTVTTRPVTTQATTVTTAPATTVTTAPPPPSSGAPVITSYTASTASIACPASDVSTTLPTPTVTLTWATQNATAVDLSVDGPGLYGTYGPSGSQTLDVACNGNMHTYTLTAKGAQGQTATKTLSVATHK